MKIGVQESTVKVRLSGLPHLFRLHKTSSPTPRDTHVYCGTVYRVKRECSSY